MAYNGNFGGMNFIWWFIWVIMMIWIFATPYNIQGRRNKKHSALDILQKRFASGAISKEEYQSSKTMLKNDLAL